MMASPSGGFGDPVNLPGVETPMARLGLGTMTFSDTVDEGVAAMMLDLALQSGVNAVDTANGYAGGASEEILAKLLATRRDDVVLATKAGIPHPDADGSAPLSAVGLRASLEGSL